MHVLQCAWLEGRMICILVKVECRYWVRYLGLLYCSGFIWFAWTIWFSYSLLIRCVLKECHGIIESDLMVAEVLPVSSFSTVMRLHIACCFGFWSSHTVGVIGSGGTSCLVFSIGVWSFPFKVFFSSCSYCPFLSTSFFPVVSASWKVFVYSFRYLMVWFIVWN